LYEDFEKRFRIPTNFVGEPPQTEAQPPHAVAELNLNPHFIFPYLFMYFYISIYFYYYYLFIIFIAIVYYVFCFIIFFLFLTLQLPAATTANTTSRAPLQLQSSSNLSPDKFSPCLFFPLFTEPVILTFLPYIIPQSVHNPYTSFTSIPNHHHFLCREPWRTQSLAFAPAIQFTDHHELSSSLHHRTKYCKPVTITKPSQSSLLSFQIQSQPWASTFSSPP
jgi:hypothetical protein